MLVVTKGLHEIARLREAHDNVPKLGYVESKLYKNLYEE
jgi:hypothetical protein